PRYGSTNGATRLTLIGDGESFADQFTLNTNDPNFGNIVTLVSRTRVFPCDVERDSTHSSRITCYTRAMPEDDYEVQLTVNGVPVPSSSICNGMQWNYWCMFHTLWYRTPSIQSITPLTGLPGTVVRLQGRIFTDVYGSNTALSSNGLRAYMGGMPLYGRWPLPLRYGLTLDSEYSDWGYMSCKMTGTYVGHHNLSYILDSEFGRSVKYFCLLNFFSEVTGVSPSEGSILGGTLLTIQGHYFDETDRPAKVLVGGHECEVQSVADTVITCRTPAYEWSNRTMFPGGRGFKMEMWNNTNVLNLEDVLNYKSSRPGYSVQWVDSLSYLWPTEIDYFVARFSGFFVPMETDNYYFLIKGDDRIQLYFSKTGHPDDKVKIAYLNSYTTSFFTSSTQRSEVMLLEEGKPYYIEVLFQQYTAVSSVDVAFFKERSFFTAQQTVDAVNEKQIIYSRYDILDEKQVVHFEGWNPAPSVQEVQRVTVTSGCFSLGSCDYTYYTLSNTISLSYWTDGSDVNITVTEDVKGKADLQTFTLLWGGIPSSPVPYNASADVLSALEDMVSAACPKKLLNVENSFVKYFRDYETDSDLSTRGTRVSDAEPFCGRWSLMNPTVLFRSDDVTLTGEAYGPVSLQQHGTVIWCICRWKYTCVNIFGDLQTSFPGTNYNLLEIHLYRDTGDYYIDTVQLGRTVTVADPNVVTMERRPPALADSGHFFQWLSVQKLGGAPRVEYEITVSGFHCASDFPLMEIGFLQVSVTEGRYQYRARNIYVERVQKASPPLNGSFSVEIFSQRVEGLATDISTQDLRYALQGIPALGQLKVDRTGGCRGYFWTIEWLSMPGSQPLLQINDSAVVGVNPSVVAIVEQRGGLFKQSIMGDFLRVPTDKTQVEVFINGIPSICSYDCSFTWSEARTPVVTGISPTQGASALGTVLSVSGSGFDVNSTVLIGNIQCTVLYVNNTWLNCSIGAASAGLYPVSLSFPGLGYAQYQGGKVFNFTYQMGVTSIVPTAGSITGGTIITISGYGFSQDTTVTIGNALCFIIDMNLQQLRCRAADVHTTIEYVLQVTGLYPQQGSLYGGTTVTIAGSGFSPVLADNSVTLGDTRCEVTNNLSVVCVYACIHSDYGQGYAWSPAVVMASLGDTVVWSWEALPFVFGLGYRVFSVATPSSTEFDGVTFNSGNTRTATGFFSYRFTTPGVYYYSSGYIDSANQRSMQGVVNVRPLEETNGLPNLHVENTVPENVNGSVSDCVAFSECPGSNRTSSGLYFSFSTCPSPIVTSISPRQGTVYDPIVIQGSGFSNTPCANEVMIGNVSCNVISSTSTEMICLLQPNSGAPVGMPLPVSVHISNLGNAMLTMPSESARRFVLLPVVDTISPVAGSTTGHTRVLITGSGLTDGAVTVAGAPCITVSSNYTHITCDTSPSPAHTGDVSVLAAGVSSSCNGDCSYEYSESMAPMVFSIYPSSVSGNLTAVFVNGSGFGDHLEDLIVYADNIVLDVMEVTDTNMMLLVGPLPAGPHALLVVVLSKGLAHGDTVLTSLPLASLQPSSGSLAGGTLLTITGNGFVVGNTSVMLGSCPCSIVQGTPFMVTCLTCANVERQVQVNIQVFGVIYPPLSFNYTRQQTPEITSVSPATGPSGIAITVSGSGFGLDAGLVSVAIAGVACDVSSITDMVLQCTVGSHPGGTYPVTLHHQVKGDALNQADFTYELRLTLVTPNEGSYGGGALVTVQGSGFDPQSSRVLICRGECSVNRNTSTSSAIYCEVPPNNGAQGEEPCSVTVLNAYGSANMTNGYTYKASLTPVITDVSPRRGGTAGGTLLTITGFAFSGGDVTVTITGSVCDVQSANDTSVICVTGSQPKSQMSSIRLQNHSDFFYIDVWSSRYTWGGESAPEAGMFVVITKGQTILLDVSTPVLKMLLIQGGKLIFDEADIELQAENILITDGGALQIGTEDQPFQHKAIITLHGHLRSPELPIYGAKTLGIREGVLDLHGIPIPIPWTRLAQTASNGSSTLILMDTVTWRVGDEIVIASTGPRHSQNENEVRTIATVSADGRLLTLTQPLNYKHLGVSITLPDGTVFEARAEVGVLTRNIVIRGSINQEWSDQISACPDGFNTGEFATQTCFQGRFGEETGSDQFGGCIMFHAPRPNENLAIGRIEYVEVFNAGQAFRLGRYPIHWHLVGDVKFKSYVRGCAIHQTYNRAVTIHNTHHLLVEHNVIYNIMGGAFFIEDGIETGNVLQYNLAVFVRQSTSLLNDDVTPAGYWVTNPNNTIRHNAAAGGTHFGYWYRMHGHPDGMSYDYSICQKMVPLGEFFNNSVHSQGWFGLWIFQEYYPQQGGACGWATPVPAVFCRLTSWNNQKGAEWVNVGAVQFQEFLVVNNEVAGVETKRIIQQYVSGWDLQGGAALVNSTFVGHVDELGLGRDYCTARAIVLPLDDGMSVLGAKFVNFDRPSCAAIGVTSIDGVCTHLCGGWSAKFSGVQFYQSPNKAAFRWEHEIALIDTDGTLTGNPGSKVVPKSKLLDPAHCSDDPAWSAGFPGAVCDNTISFHRLAFNNPSPYSLIAKDVILTNTYGTSVLPFVEKLITHSFGWMALLPSDKTYNWYFHGASQITNISYNAMFYGFRPEDYVIVNHNLTQSPDWFHIVDNRVGSSEPLNASVNVNGDWYFNKSSNNLYYMVSGRETPSRGQTGSVDRSTADRAVAFSVYTCFFPNCTLPSPPPPTTLAPLPGSKPANFIAWSNDSFWRSSPENNFTVPREGADVIIPTGVWMVLDTTIPALNKLTVVGVLEIPDATNSTASRAAPGIPVTVVVNATYISIQGGHLLAGQPDRPFSGELHIILRGDYRTPEWPLPSGPNQGSKVLGVFGSLDLYGMPHNVYHTKLANAAQAGSSSLSLMEAVDWQAGDDIVLSTTSYDPWQTETHTIAVVSDDGLTLTLDHPLDYTHIAENYAVPGTSQSYRLASDVGLLSRNIKIIGQNYPGLYEESFGARVLVGAFSMGGAQIRDVEFYLTGQEGWTDYTDPRYSLAFLNLGVTEHGSYLKGCAFHHGFAPAVGIFGTHGLNVDDNIIHHTVGEGIFLIRRNLVTMTLWPGSYNGRQDTFNFNWNAAIEANTGTNVVLQGNTVAGYERVGFSIDGEPCPGTFSPVAQWQENEAHGGLFGIYMNNDGLPGCVQIQDFTVWRSFDFGIYFQVSMSVLISNVTLVDNGMGIMPLIYGPSAVTHEYSNKTVTNALIVGSSPNFNCSDRQPLDTINIALTASSRAPRPLNGGRTGISWPTFESSQNGAPVHSHDGLMSYPAISGLLTVTDTTFVGFMNVCSSQTNYMFMTDPNNEDLEHPISVRRITKSNSTDEALVFIHHPDLSKVNPSDCVDMDCDAKKKALLKDLDGSFLGAVGAVIPKSEYEWNGDPRHGLGDYRIPKVMLTYLNGSRIPVMKIAPNKGIIRNNCTYISTWQAYKCFGLDYLMLVIESLDVDTETRRLSPVAVLGDGYLDLLNGPQDHGWCFGYTCQKRVSLFHSIVATNHSFDIYFSSISPQKLRLMMLNAAPSEAVRVAVFYSNPQRLDVYASDHLVAPNNAKWNSDNTNYLLLQPTYIDQYMPGYDSPHGSNYFDPDYKILHILVRGSKPVQIRTSPLLIIAFNIPAMTEAEFYGDKLVRNLALFLNIPSNMIRITNIVREGSTVNRQKRATALMVQVQISQPPVNQLSTNSTGGKQSPRTFITADTIGQAAVFGNLSQAIGFNVSTVELSLPMPPPSDPSWSQVAGQQVTRESPAVSTLSSVSALRVVVDPLAGLQPGLLIQQPCIMAVDQQGNCVSVGVTSLTILATLQDAQGNQVSGLSGNTSIPFSGCWGNYTDLAISTSENLTLAFTLNTWQVQSRALSYQTVPRNASDTIQTNNSTASSITTLTNTTSSVASTTQSSSAIVTGTVNVLTLLSALLLLYCAA
uniref:Polycystic kidney and hepatic disease 1 (autosomal recessive)-like 1 n=1 Tax=Electrophorus electricus TaxID=8005 RepID=A0AAY5ETB4_ELEEL